MSIAQLSGWQVQGLQLAGSLLAIVFIAWLVRQMGLGGDVRLRSEDVARKLADEAIYGFGAVDVALDRAGIGALLRDEGGRVMLLRRQGVHFVARLLDSHAGVRLDRNFLEITTSDARFGMITLDLGAKAGVWAGSLRRLGA
ncbi:MAG: hypothetical protein RLY97_317 [Pseudomonadota bacterium]|jgi:hypothetical protein